jgi:hypothetical protein
MKRRRLLCAGPKGPWCTTMATRLAEQTSARHRAGIEVFVTTNDKTLARTIHGIVHRANRRDNGLMLNHCPWCGAWISPERRGPTGTSKTEREEQARALLTRLGLSANAGFVGIVKDEWVVYLHRSDEVRRIMRRSARMPAYRGWPVRIALLGMPGTDHARELTRSSR